MPLFGWMKERVKFSPWCRAMTMVNHGVHVLLIRLVFRSGESRNFFPKLHADTVICTSFNGHSG
jgi:hypothetical protein